MVVFRYPYHVLIAVLPICMLRGATSDNSTTDNSAVLNEGNRNEPNLNGLNGQRLCPPEYLLSWRIYDDDCITFMISGSGWDYCCPPICDKYKEANPVPLSRPVCTGECNYRIASARDPNSNCHIFRNHNSGNDWCCVDFKGNRQPMFNNPAGNMNLGTNKRTCRKDYHLTGESNYTCCYEHKAGGSLKYCCPSQTKAFKENCQPTRKGATTCPSNWARSFMFYDSRCYLFKTSDLGDDYCCPISSQRGLSCWKVGYESSYRPNSTRCFKHKYGEYCCPKNKRW